MAVFELNYVQMALLCSFFLPDEKWTLAIDRTNWKFGKQHHNILALTAYCRGVGVPLMYEILDNNGGNSDQSQRIDLIGKFIQIFGHEKIHCIIGDREFIGEKWCKWLLSKGVDFYIRIKDNAVITLHNGTQKSARHLVYWKKKRYLRNVEVFGNLVNVALNKTNKRNSKGEWENIIIITSLDPMTAFNAYNKRWSIEVFFQSIKGRGFNLETTHLKEHHRLKKLFCFVCIAFILCLYIGIWHHDNIKTIKVQNHGYKRNSFFRHGLDLIQEAFNRNNAVPQLIVEIIRILALFIAEKLNFKPEILYDNL